MTLHTGLYKFNLWSNSNNPPTQNLNFKKMKPPIINRIGQYRVRSWYQRSEGAIRVITVHHTADNFVGSDDAILSREAGFHTKNNGWPGLSYHYFICPGGQVYQINSHTDITWHDARNSDTLGIALHGNFHNTGAKPTTQQLASLKALLDWLCRENPQLPANERNVYGHREISPTACPGDQLQPLIVEYRKKIGQVSWGSPVANADEQVSIITSAIQTIENAITQGEQQKDPKWKVKNKANKNKLLSLASRV